MSKKRGFTLIEILIVIVIIGILAAAILPKLTGGASKARDTKRQADLRNMGAAIQMYRMEQGTLPLMEGCDGNTCGVCTVLGDASRLGNTLSSYLATIPSDPQKNAFVKIHHVLHTLDFGKITERFGDDLRGGKVQNPGQYLYQVFSYRDDNFGGAVLVSRVENPEYANYVLKKSSYNAVTKSYVPKKSLGGGAWSKPAIGNIVDGERCMNKSTNRIEDLKLCDKITVSDEISSSPLQDCDTKRKECKLPCIEEEKTCEQQQQSERDKCEKDKSDCEQEEREQEQQCNEKREQCIQKREQCLDNKKKCKEKCEWWDVNCKNTCNDNFDCGLALDCGTKIGCKKNLNCGGELSCDVKINHNCWTKKNACVTEKGCLSEAFDCGIDAIGGGILGNGEVADRCVYTPNDELYYIKVIK